MATYDELRDVLTTAIGDPLKSRLVVAITIKAQTLVDGTPTAGQLLWAQEALADPISKVPQVLNYMVASNKGSAQAVITGAADALVQSQTNSAIDALVA